MAKGLKGLNTKEGESAENERMGGSGAASFIATRRAINKSTPIRQEVGQYAPEDFGKSSYDEAVESYDQLYNLQDVRANEQPWYSKLANGIAKGVILAGTTFLDGTVGLATGALTAASQQKFSGLWNNPFSQAMQKINEASEELLPNYYSTEEQEAPWYENIISANFIGDKFIKNLGFSVGALYSGGIYTAALKATKIPRILGALTRSLEMPGMITATVGATIGAVNEGRIEALNNSKDWFELHKTKLNDNTAERLDNLGVPYERSENGDINITGDDALSAKERDIYNSTLSKMSEDRLKMGNMDLLMNIPLLTLSNYIQFSRFFANGFKTAKRGANIVKRDGLYAGGTGKARLAYDITKGATSEGLEEISQKAASNVAGNYYSTDVNNFYKAKTDREAEMETLDFMKANAQGINETVNDGSSWEEFFIGALTGALGIPTFRSAKSSDGSFQSPITMEGGAYEHIKEYREKVLRENEIASYLNSRVQNPETLNYYRGLIRHYKYQKDMNKAVEDNDEFEFKNAEHAQLVSDIIMFDNAGKLDDLEAIIDAAADTSDANIESIIENTTSTLKNGDKVGPFVDSKGNPMSKEDIVSKMQSNKESILKTINDYRKIKNDIDLGTGQVLSDDQLEELTWMKSQLTNWSERAATLSGEFKGIIGKITNNLNSYLNFQRDIRTKEGMSNTEVTDKYEKADKAVRSTQKFIDTLDSLRALNDSAFAATLAKNSKFVDHLMLEIASLDNSAISPDEKIEALHKLEDIVKLGNAAETYNSKLEEYFKNPGKQTADHKKADEEAAKDLQERNNASLRERLTQAKSVAEFRQALNEEQNSDTRDEVLNSLIAEDNKVAKNYKETTLYNAELEKALDELGESNQVVQDAMTLWKEQFNAAENLEQVSNPNSVHINNDTAFSEDSGGDVDLSTKRFEAAKYALQKAMSKVNNGIKFKNRFSSEVATPVGKPDATKGTDRNTTGDSGTPTVPHVNPSDKAQEIPTPVGNITADMVANENRASNERSQTQRDLDRSQQGQRKYYRPAVPELHIEASKEGDFRPFDVVVNEREKGVDFSAIYNYLRDNGAFSYVNAAKLKPGDTLGFMIDPEFNDHTIFLVDTRNNQIVGSIDESDASVARYEGLAEIIKKVRDEYQASREGQQFATRDNTDTNKVDVGSLKPGDVVKFQGANIKVTKFENGILYGTMDDGSNVRVKKDQFDQLTPFSPTPSSAGSDKGKSVSIPKPAERFFATPQTRVSKMMIGRIPYSTEERSLADIPGVTDGNAKPIFGIIKNGTLTTNGKIDDRLIIKPTDMSQKEGRLYLLIPNAAGTYSPAAVRVRHFNNQEFNLNDATVTNTPIGKSVNTAIDKLSDATSQDDVSLAMKDLAQDLYMQDVMITWFDANAGSGIVISKKVRKPDGTYEMVNINGQDHIKEDKFTIYFQSSKKEVDLGGGILTDREAIEEGIKHGYNTPEQLALFGQPRDASDIRKDILNTLLRFNLPLQVSVSRINETGYNNRIINSNILTSNLREAKVIGSWFTTDYFDKQGNLQQAVSPASVKPAPGRGAETPVGGTEGVVKGTRIYVNNTSYIVDLKNSIITDEKTGKKWAFSTSDRRYAEIAWAQENFGDNTESSVMTENKVITPSGQVLDRNTGRYVSDTEAKRIKDKIAGRNQAAQNKIANSKRVIADIYENQKRVDKTRTDSDYYYILEDDGQYHKYSRVHSRLGDNWTGERTETENSRRALEAGTAIDKVIRDFFTSKETPTKPDNISDAAFIDLISKLTEIKSKMEQLGETFMTNNIVLFQKYTDGTRVAGEVDILSVDKNGNFKIYDVKTSKYSFSSRYFTEKSSKQRMSTKDYYTLQLSAYQNLFESQYGVRPVKLAILPFVLSYGTTQGLTSDIPSGTQTKLGLPIGGNQNYFRTDRKADDSDAMFVSSEKEGKTYFKPILDTPAHVGTLKGSDSARFGVEFVGGDPKDATSFVLVEPGEATKSDGKLVVTKKAKVFAVTPSTPYSNTKSVVNSIVGEKGIVIDYNSAVNVPLASTAKVPKAETQSLESPNGTYEQKFNSLVARGILTGEWGNSNGREVIVVNADGVKILFYKSSEGTDGKTRGSWYPIFGFGKGRRSSSSTSTSENNWLIKGSIEDMENGYGIPILKQIQKVLNESFGWEPGALINRSQHNIFKSESLSSEELNKIVLGREDSGVQNGVNSENHIKEYLQRFSQTLNPIDNNQESLPIFDASLETMNPENRVLPENAFEEGGEIGFYEKDGKLYTGYIKKAGEVEVTTSSGQKIMIPVHVTKVRDIGFGQGKLGSTSEYIVVFPNGYAMTVVRRSASDGEAFKLIMDALAAKPEKVLSLSSEKTQIHNPRELEEMEIGARNRQYSSETAQLSGAAATIQKEDAINNHDEEFEDELDLGELRKVDDGSRKTWNKEKELAWLKRVLPQLSEEDRVRVVEGLIQVSNNGPVAWGMYSKGIITLSDMAAEGTSYHEAFHLVMDLMLTGIEKEALFQEARAIFGNKSLRELEEDMAEGFREYVVSQETRGFGERIIDFFKNLFAKVTNWKYVKPSLNSYYRMINQGRYKSYNLEESNTSRFRVEEPTSEMQYIKSKAITDGTFMKAPNGNPTNLTERQWLQVRTKAFKDWFGDWENSPSEASKVVDENGEPKVVYRWDGTDFTVFDKRKQGTRFRAFYGKGFYFTSSKYFANWFGRKNLAKPYFINSRELEEIDWEQSYKNTYMKGDSNEYGDRHVTNIHYNVPLLRNKTLDEYVISNPNQIKSATINSGEFSTTNDDVRYRTVPNSSWEVVDKETRQSLETKGWTQEKFDSISQAERDNAVECVVL